MSTTFEDFIDKLAPYPNDVNRLARLVRFLDKRVENIQNGLINQQKKFQLKIKQLKDKKATEVPAQLRAEYEVILQKQKELYGYAKQKQAVAQQLLHVINCSYEAVKNDLKNKIKDKPTEDLGMNKTKNKKPKTTETMTKSLPKQDQFFYDPVNQKYCYCSGYGYGEMVGCENNYCEKQWFHGECIEEKNYANESVWYCKDCKKLIEKYKKSATMKEFL